MEARKCRESTVKGVTGACDEPAEMERCVRNQKRVSEIRRETVVQDLQKSFVGQSVREATRQGRSPSTASGMRARSEQMNSLS